MYHVENLSDCPTFDQWILMGPQAFQKNSDENSSLAGDQLKSDDRIDWVRPEGEPPLDPLGEIGPVGASRGQDPLEIHLVKHEVHLQPWTRGYLNIEPFSSNPFWNMGLYHHSGMWSND